VSHCIDVSLCTAELHERLETELAQFDFGLRLLRGVLLVLLLLLHAVTQSCQTFIPLHTLRVALHRRSHSRQSAGRKLNYTPSV